MAAAVAEEHAAAREVERQETNQRAGEQECQRRDEVLPLQSGVPREKPAADQPQSGAQAVHVVLKINGVGDGQNPQHGDGVAEEWALDEDRHADAASGDRERDQHLTGELPLGRQVAPVVDDAERQHGHRTAEDGGELPAALGQAVSDDAVERFRQRAKPGPRGDGEDRHGQARDNGQAAGQRDGMFVNFPVARLVQQPDMFAPASPQRQ